MSGEYKEPDSNSKRSKETETKSARIEYKTHTLEKLPLLRLEADVHFSLGRFDPCLELLKRIRAAEVNQHGAESQHVLDTDLAICVAQRAVAIPEAIRVDKAIEDFIMCEELELLMLIGGVRKRCAAFKKEVEYEPEPDCAKMLVAEWFNKFEKNSTGVKKIILKLYEEAYKERLDKFGPDRLKTLVAERMYYIEKTYQLEEGQEDLMKGQKGALLEKLKNRLGERHKLVKGLEVKLRLPATESEVGYSDFEETINDLIGGVTDSFEKSFKLAEDQRTEKGMIKFLMNPESIVATEKFYETMLKTGYEWTKQNKAEGLERLGSLPAEQKRLLGRFEAFLLRGETDKALYLVNKLRRATNVQTMELYGFLKVASQMIVAQRFDDALWCANMMKDLYTKEYGPHHVTLDRPNKLILEIMERLGPQATYIQDQERIKAARERVETNLKLHGPEHTTTLKAKFHLAEALLAAFEYDEGFSLLMDIYPLQALRLGHKHPEPMSSLEALLTTDFTEELVSFEVLKKAYGFFDDQCPVLTNKFAKTDWIVLKAMWFQAYVKAVVIGNYVGIEDQHAEFKVMEQTLVQYVQKYPDFTDKYWMLAQIGFMYFKHPLERNGTSNFIAVNYTRPYVDRLPINDRISIQLRCNLAREVQKWGHYEKAITDIKQLYKQARKVLQPHDTTLWQILDTIRYMFVMVRRDSGPLPDDINFFRQAAGRLECLLGPHHHLTVRALSLFTYIVGKWDFGDSGMFPSNLDEFEKCGRDALSRAIKVFSKDHEVTIQARRGLAGIIFQRDRRTRGYLDIICKKGSDERRFEAVCQLKQVVESIKMLKGERHYAFDRMCRDVCRGYKDMLVFNEALNLALQVLEIHKTSLGPKHVITQVAEKAVEEIRETMKKDLKIERMPNGSLQLSWV